MADTSQPAFPMPPGADPHGNGIWPEYGLSKREYFAGQALVGVAASMAAPAEDINAAARADGFVGTIAGYIAFRSVLMADALIAALEKSA